jgi:hypothetical protein
MAKRDRDKIKAGMAEVLAAGGDLVSQVVAGDRRRAGRGTKTTNYDNMTSNTVITETTKPPVRKGRRGQPAATAGGSADIGAANLGARLQQAAEMAASPTITVTLRLPLELNHWLDTYVHGAWPERIRKQELVTEALRMLVARRGAPGETVLATELLPSEKNNDWLSLPAPEVSRAAVRAAVRAEREED